MAVWGGLGQAATVAQLDGADVGGLITMIMKAAMTAQQNKKECEQLARRVFTIAELLHHLQDPEVLRRPEIRRPLTGLDDTLREAHELVLSCQDKSAVYQLVMAGRQADRFRDVQSRIDSYLLLFPVISHMDITRRLDRIYNILLPNDMARPSMSPISMPPNPVPAAQVQIEMGSLKHSIVHMSDEKHRISPDARCLLLLLPARRGAVRRNPQASPPPTSHLSIRSSSSPVFYAGILHLLDREHGMRCRICNSVARCVLPWKASPANLIDRNAQRFQHIRARSGVRTLDRTLNDACGMPDLLAQDGGRRLSARSPAGMTSTRIATSLSGSVTTRRPAQTMSTNGGLEHLDSLFAANSLVYCRVYAKAFALAPRQLVKSCTVPIHVASKHLIPKSLSRSYGRRRQPNATASLELRHRTSPAAIAHFLANPSRPPHPHTTLVHSQLPIPPTSPPFAGTHRTSSAVQLPGDLLCLGQSYMAGLVVRCGQGPSAAWRKGEGPPLVAGGGGDVDRAGDDGGGEGDGQATKTVDGVRRLRMAKFVWRGTHGVKEFTFKELATATNNFSPDRKIGLGSFSTVYMGRLPDGREVAIKRMVERSFENIYIMRELSILRSISHQHIIRVFGSCVKEKRQLLPPFRKKQEETLLVLEYMENGSLDSHLHGPPSSSPVMTSWKTRIEILLGVSRAIEYMKSYGERPVIHRDIKPANILLDASWAPRLSDFLLALTEEGEVIGTLGYMDPEYAMTGNLNLMTDIYSFGVVMLEVLTGKKPYFSKEEWEEMEKTEECVEEEKREEREQEGKNTGEDKEESEREEEEKTEESPPEWLKLNQYDFGGHYGLVSFALPLIEAGKLWKVLDRRPAADPTPTQLEAAELVAQMTVRCLQLQWEERPAISEIVANLEKALELARCDG
uniref:Protein kinase domain-containing protein n=1 Tax=Oryza barthii TaxID=65489 RepID=A0A0D3HPP7_9ORYZ